MRLLHTITIVLMMLMALSLVWINVSLYWPVRTLEIHNYLSPGIVSTTKPTFKIGEPIAYKLDYCKYTTATASVTRTLVDGQIITLSDANGYLPDGCHTTVVETAIVPTTMNPGVYYLDVVVRYRVNPLRIETVHYKTNSFTITR